ncbi:hypothetical protein NL503_27785, partial [Klebsiella pneumoniae]|nr:hypothetical protein [Klebsiella pneumoniae]
VNETKDAAGNTVVHFSDGKTATISKGDTGATGVAGKDAAPLTVTSSEKDGQGNTLVHFSDGSTITVDKGDRGETGAQGAKGDPGKDGASIG